MKHIGIIGVTVPGAVLCINTIIEESYRHFGSDSMNHPRFTYINPPLVESEHWYETKDWDSLGRYIVGLIDSLIGTGVDFIVIPSNSPHYAISYIKEHAKIPVISIIDLVIEECLSKGHTNIGILGVSATMSDGLYEYPLRDHGFITYLLDDTDQLALNNLIYQDIILGNPTQKTADQMLYFVEKLKNMVCETFVAGCTEIPIVLNDRCPLSYIDTTRLLAQKAFQYAIT